jgi:orotate phosphoribosyltransferase
MGGFCMGEKNALRIDVFRNKRALWLFDHKGDPKRPHALLTSGKHSDGFFNSGKIAMDAFLLDDIARELISEHLTSISVNTNDVDWVIGPAMGGITFAHAMASGVSYFSGEKRCLTSYVEKEEYEEGGKKNTRMVFKRNPVEKGMRILLVEDVITTGGSIEKTEKAIIEAGGIVLPYMFCLVNRSGKEEISGKKIHSFVKAEISTWESDNCPLCKGGSEAIKPKGKEEWKKLTGGI